jgi:hypothetical protein
VSIDWDYDARVISSARYRQAILDLAEKYNWPPYQHLAWKRSANDEPYADPVRIERTEASWREQVAKMHPNDQTRVRVWLQEWHLHGGYYYVEHP